VGNVTFDRLREKYGSKNHSRLSKLTKKLFKRKQMEGEAAADYTNDMRALVMEIERNAGHDTKKIWECLKSTALVYNLRDDTEGKLAKKLVHNRLAEAESQGNPLKFEDVESIIDNDADNAEEKPKKKEPSDLVMPMQDKGFGRGGKGKDNYGYGQWWPQQQQWPPQQQWGRYQQWPPYKGDKGAGRGGKDKGKDKGNKGMTADQVQSLKEKAKAAHAEYKQAKDAAEYGDG
jgi:hypothetical protein